MTICQGLITLGEGPRFEQTGYPLTKIGHGAERAAEPMNKQLAEELGKASGKELSQASSGIDRLPASLTM